MSHLRLGVIFPGQGSQSLGMMSELRADSQYRAVIDHTFQEAGDALSLDMWQVVNDDRLNDTQFTQPAILTASIAIWRAIVDKIPTPAYLAGHSLGEYSALVASGVIDFAQALQLVRERGRLMSGAVSGLDTKMAAILGLADEQVIALCHEVSQTVGIVDVANFNSPAQVVVAGLAQAVDVVMTKAQALSAKAIVLKVSVPSHCQLMLPACEQLAVLLQQTPFAMPNIAVIQNVNADVANQSDAIKDALICQLSQSVQWTQTMQQLANHNIDLLIECGYGTVLSNLAKRQACPIATFATDTPKKITQLMEKIHESSYCLSNRG